MDTKALEALIQGGESQTVEFKAAPPRYSELAERMCGLANSLGGFIIIGVADQSWEIVGVTRPHEAIDVILYSARMCKPPLRLDPALPQAVVIHDKIVVVAVIPPNDGTLYQAGGVFWIRRGTRTIPLELTEIEQWLYHRGTLAWETRVVQTATLADLDMELVAAYLAQRSDRSQPSGRLANQEEVLIKMGCAKSTVENGQAVTRPTNAGLLLFGAHPQDFLLQAEVVCILFPDTLGLRRFADRRIIHGTIAEQIDRAAAFFAQHIPVAARMAGFHRVDEPDYPLEALREAVVNAVIHRDYSLAGEAVRIFYYRDRIEIRNPGLLMPGLTLAEVQEGRARSKPRNPLIASILRDFPGGYVERVGTGISFMIEQMRQLGKPAPLFREQGEFIVTFLKKALPTDEKNASREEIVAVARHTEPTEKEIARAEFQDTVEAESGRQERQALALRYVQEHGSITNKEYRLITGVSENSALRDLEKLVEQGMLRAVGKKRARKYLF